MYQKIKSQLADKNVNLVAVSKTKSKEAILEIYHHGQRIFGENRTAELREKQEALPKDISWHMIGSLQKNKVKHIAPFVDLIHSVDSLSLAEQIHKEAIKNDRRIPILLQYKIGTELTKQGLDIGESQSAIQEILRLENIAVHGVMGMASFTNDHEQVRKEFKQLKSIFDQLKNQYFQNIPEFKEISMGMSGDYEIAIEEGATLVRIGSLIFGSRN